MTDPTAVLEARGFQAIEVGTNYVAAEKDCIRVIGVNFGQRPINEMVDEMDMRVQRRRAILARLGR